MQYEIYVGNDLIVTALSIEDVMYYINVNDLSIIEENEDFDTHTVIIDCENKQEANIMGLLVVIVIMVIGAYLLKEGV